MADNNTLDVPLNMTEVFLDLPDKRRGLGNVGIKHCDLLALKSLRHDLTYTIVSETPISETF